MYGQGFLFDDADPEASPIAEMHRLIRENPRNRERIFAYLGGEELNSSPTQVGHRYTINFGRMREDEARQWPDLLKILEAKVRPQRASLKRESIARRWWQFGETQPGLVSAIEQGLGRVLVCCQTSKYLSFVFAPSDVVFSHKVVVVTSDQDAYFTMLQSRVHEGWALFFGSTMKDDPVYTASDCFETFPFPPGWEQNPALEAAGQTYYTHRAALMIRNNEGLTTTYNRFHSPDEHAPDILELRALHAAMDRAVLDAYGWTDVPTACEFLLDYEDPEEEDDEGGKRKKKKPWRYRWPDEVRDDVLARLIALNQKRAEEEAAASR